MLLHFDLLPEVLFFHAAQNLRELNGCKYGHFTVLRVLNSLLKFHLLLANGWPQGARHLLLNAVQVLLATNGLSLLFLGKDLVLEVICLLLTLCCLLYCPYLINFGNIAYVAGIDEAFTSYVCSMILHDFLHCHLILTSLSLKDVGLLSQSLVEGEFIRSFFILFSLPLLRLLLLEPTCPIHLVVLKL